MDEPLSDEQLSNLSPSRGSHAGPWVPMSVARAASQVVVVETGGGPVVVGDMAVWFGELDEPHTEGQLRVRALDPELVWLAHEHEPWRPRTV